MPLLASLFRRPGAARPGAQRPRPEANRFRPRLETLEDRTVPVLISSQVGGVSFVFSNVNSFVATFVQSTVATNTQGFVPVACPSNVPSQFQDCIQMFESMGLTSPVKKNQGNGQDKFWVCHFTGSSTNPYVLILVAQPAAFGGHLRQGDMVLTTNGGTTFGTFLNEQGQVVTQPV
jgi:hypothetical protein